jgi:hypothetical protein
MNGKLAHSRRGGIAENAPEKGVRSKEQVITNCLKQGR